MRTAAYKEPAMHCMCNSACMPFLIPSSQSRAAKLLHSVPRSAGLVCDVSSVCAHEYSWVCGTAARKREARLLARSTGRPCSTKAQDCSYILAENSMHSGPAVNTCPTAANSVWHVLLLGADNGIYLEAPPQFTRG